MTDTRPRLIPGPDHPITLNAFGPHVIVRAGPVVVAETDRALELHEAAYPPVLYIPLDDVDRSLLKESDEHTYCPYKGEASYFDVDTGTGAGLPASIWFYDDPYPHVEAIAGHVAFYADRFTIESASGDQ